MGSNILGIGQSALAAAQVGVATTGHNIANAATPGFSRQVVVQSAVAAGDSGFAFVGRGTEVSSVSRVYNGFLAGQVLTAQTSDAQLSTYNTQIKQIDNLLANPNAGLSPALQDFFSGVQALSSDPNSAASRQALLSSGEALASRFQSLSGQLSEIGQGVNAEIGTSIGKVNVYASQIARLNDAIEIAQAGGNKTANDLLDQRDQAVSELSKEIKVSVVRQGESYNVFIGSGQPLVVGTKTTTLYATNSPTDSARAEVGVRSTSGATLRLDESSLTGGKLGGLFEFRSGTLDAAQNTLGRVATNLAGVFNAQHSLGQTQTGALGGNFFTAAAPEVTPSSLNNAASTAQVSATISNASALTVSNYRLQVVAGSSSTLDYRVTRLSDGKSSTFAGPATAGAGITFNVDGVDIKVGSGSAAAGDEFLVRPVANGAAKFAVDITDRADIAAGAPVTSSFTTSNRGTGAITAPAVGSTALIPSGLALTYAAPVSPATTGTLSGFPANQPVTVTTVGSPASPSVSTTYAAGTPVPVNGGETVSFGGVDVVVDTPPASVSVPPPSTTLSYSVSSSGAKSLSGFPIPLAITVTANGVSTTYPPGTAVPYTSGATISFGGISLAVSGAPADGDTFKVGGNPNGLGDNRNALLLGKLQTTATLDGGTTTLQGAYTQLVSSVGSKANELQATSSAAASLLQQAVASQQAESGVNLDEEAANLLRYQQAYQAAGKLIQTASTLFSVLLSLGNN